MISQQTPWRSTLDWFQGFCAAPFAYILDWYKDLSNNWETPRVSYCKPLRHWWTSPLHQPPEVSEIPPFLLQKWAKLWSPLLINLLCAGRLDAQGPSIYNSMSRILQDLNEIPNWTSLVCNWTAGKFNQKQPYSTWQQTNRKCKARYSLALLLKPCDWDKGLLLILPLLLRVRSTSKLKLN